MGFKVGDVVRRKSECIGASYRWDFGTDPVTVVETWDNSLAFDEVDLTWDVQCFELVKEGTPECRILTSNFQIALAAAINVAEQNGAGQSAYAQGLRDVLEASRRGERIVVRDE